MESKRETTEEVIHHVRTENQPSVLPLLRVEAQEENLTIPAG